MKLQRLALVLIGLTFLLAGSSFAGDVKTDYDRDTKFEQFKTYSWQDVKTKDPLMVARIKSAVNAALQSKGFMEVPSGGDISVMAHEITRDKQTLNTYYDDFGGGWRFGGFGDATTTTETYKEGTLVVDLFGTNTKKLLWRGSATDELSDNSDKNIKNINNDVKKMFEKFPPDNSKKK